MKKFLSIICLVFTTLFLANHIQISLADTIDEIQEKIDISNQNKEKLEREIATYQKQLDTISAQANNLQNTIKSLDISASKISTEVKLTENRIDGTSLDIQDTNFEINNKANQINRDHRALAETIRKIAEADNQTPIEILLLNDNMSDFWVDLETTIQFQKKIREQVITVKSVKDKLEIAQAKLLQKKKELEDYNKDLIAQKQILQNTKKEKATLLTTTKNTQANYAKILADKKALMDAVEAEIAKYESELKMAIDPSSYPKSGKGILAWPLDNINARITQYFGKTAYSGRLYASGTHNGVDFGVPIGTRVKSAGSGVVEGTGDTDPICPGASWGKWVFIRYDNGLASTYGHLSSIVAKVGQRVKAGDIVGYSGNSGYSTGPHFHISVYAGQGVKVTTLKSSVCKGTYVIPLADQKAYLDPLAYL